MALFSTKKNTKKAAAPAKEASTGTGIARDLAHILSHARITEKATMNHTNQVYTFDVATEATKRDVIRAVYQIYKVTPKSVNMVTVPTKEVRNARTGRKGVKGGGKKAYVYLKSGDSIIIS